MDISRLFDGLALLIIVVLAVHFVTKIDAWRSSVSALHLRWEREQRQAGAGGVTLSQRQAVQTEFESLVANRPMRLMWMHVTLAVLAIVFVLLLAWRIDDMRWIGFWLALPIGITIVAIYGFGTLMISQANDKLTAISSSLYGPAPPRVKVRAIQTVESKDSEN